MSGTRPNRRSRPWNSGTSGAGPACGESGEEGREQLARRLGRRGPAPAPGYAYLLFGYGPIAESSELEDPVRFYKAKSPSSLFL